MIFEGKADEFLQLDTLVANRSAVFHNPPESSMTILWNIRDDAHLEIDGISYCIPENQLIFLTEFHRVKAIQLDQVRLIRFNKSFFCILDHDSKVGCKGVLFFGTSTVPIVQIPASEVENFETLWKMFNLEMVSKDNLQMEMLQMMLKRLLILCTRLYKAQENPDNMPPTHMNIIREFYFLVEHHFKKHRDVRFYASQLFKSPKTLSNLFATYYHKTPLQVIQERILLEARRQLHYTDKPIKEIAYTLGYEDIQTFSRFFKTKENLSPAEYRENSRNPYKKGSIANSWGKYA